MKPVIILAILLILIGGFLVVHSISQESPSRPSMISGIHDLVLNRKDLQQLGMTSDLDEQDLQQLGLINGNNCLTDDEYSNIVDSSLGQYSMCAYLVPGLNDTQVVLQLQKFANIEALNGSYQYDSLHLYSIEGLISENTFGDQSRFRVNNENDYGGQFNEPGVYYYHLWICKNEYLIHITSKGTEESAIDYVAEIGQLILSKFG